MNEKTMMKLTLAIATMMVLVAITVQALDFDSVKKSISNTVNSVANTVQGSACLIENQDKFDLCNQQMNRLEYRTAEENTEKDLCCSFLAYRSCLQTTAQLYCGGYAEQAVETLMNSIKSMFPGNCERYDNIFDCMNPVLFWAIVAAVVIVAILITCSVISCLKRMCC